MNLATEIAVHVVTELEQKGYLKQGTRWKDETLLPMVAKVVDDHLSSTRVEFARFCIWWAEIGHSGHAPKETEAPFAPRDFWHCQQPMCLSLVGTIVDLSRELKSTPSAIAESAGYAPPSLP